MTGVQTCALPICSLMDAAAEDTKTAVTASGPPGAHEWIERVLYSEEEVQERVRALAQRINVDLAGKKVVVVVRIRAAARGGWLGSAWLTRLSPGCTCACTHASRSAV